MGMVVVSLWGSTSAILAYDCSALTTNISRISVKDVADCPEQDEEYIEKPVKIQLLQRNQFSNLKIYNCLIEVTRSISHCGMHSHSSTVSGGLSSYVHTLGADLCKNVHQTGTLNFMGHHLITKLKSNSTVVAPLVFQGKLDKEGNCKGGTYIENGETWADVVVQGSVTIKLSDYYGVLTMDQNLVKLNGGTSCAYLEGYCLDQLHGEVTWEIEPNSNCESKFTTIYHGSATMVEIRGTTDKYMVVEHQDRVFALNLIKKSYLCFTEVYVTEHPRLVVYLVENQSMIFTSQAVNPRDVDLISYINSKFMYVEHSIKQSLNRLYKETIHRRCLLKREILMNRLLMAPLSPNAVSTLLKNHPGYVGRMIGEVLYVLQCIPKTVQIRRESRCFNELPVIDKTNKTYFMAPITHILTERGEEVDCNVATPPMYQIDDQWVAMNPYPTVQNPPEKLEVREEPVFQFSPLYGFGTAGLYTREDLIEAQNSIKFGIEKAAIQSVLVRRLQGKETTGSDININNMFYAEELRKFAKSTLWYLWGWFTDFGMAISGCIGVIVILRVIKSMASVILNGYALYKTMGCGLIIIASIWNNLTMWLLNKHKPTNDVPIPETIELIPTTLESIPENPVTPTAPVEPNVSVTIKNPYPSIPNWMKP